MQSIKMSDELLSDLQTALFGSTNLSWFRDVSGQHFMELPGYDHLCQENSIFFRGKEASSGRENSLLKLRVFFIPKITMLVLRILALRRNFSKVMLN